MNNDTSTLLDARLAELPHPAPPPDLTGIVLARIAQLDAERVTDVTGARRPGRDLVAYIAALAGVVAGIVLVIGSPAANSPGDFSIGWMRAMTPNLLSLPSLTMSSGLLAGGLLLFAVGLLTPVGVRSERS